jgi:hypothetical protein
MILTIGVCVWIKLVKHTQLLFFVSIFSSLSHSLIFLFFFVVVLLLLLVYSSVLVCLSVCFWYCLTPFNKTFARMSLPAYLAQFAFSLSLSPSSVRSMPFCAFFTIINRENRVKKKEKKKKSGLSDALAFAELARRAWVPRFSSSSTESIQRSYLLRSFLVFHHHHQHNYQRFSFVIASGFSFLFYLAATTTSTITSANLLIDF